MTSPPNRPTGSARVPGPDDPGGATGAGLGRPAGRASVGGSASVPSGRHSADGGGSDYSDYSDYRPSYGGSGSSGGRASVGRSGAGRASVGSASVGSASVGSASVSGGGYGYGGEGTGHGTSRLGSVGRASVRPGGPGGDDPLGDPLGPPLTRAEERRLAAQANGGDRKRKKRRRRRRIIAASAVLLMLVGIGTIGGTFYFTSIEPPKELQNPQASTISFAGANGAEGAPIAKIGGQDANRQNVDISKVPTAVKMAVVGAEDMTFYSNSGVDLKGFARSAWDDVTGGSHQGGSTITMQYAKLVEDPSQTNRSPTEKLKETVAAIKLNQKYTKDQILGFYLNTIYFNRAYGIGQAAKEYFNTDVTKLTAEQAAVLAADIKDPSGYDPSVNPQAAKARWTYVLQNMAKLGAYPKDKVASAVYPKVQTPGANDGTKASGPYGVIAQQVENELKSKLNISHSQLAKNGYHVTTTIQQNVEDDAIKAAEDGIKDQKQTLADALVAVQPGTGQVMAYYGGEQGYGYDLAGHAHQPGSSFKIYTLEAGLENGYSIDGYWNGDPSESFPDRSGDGKVYNSDNEKCDDGGKSKDGHLRCSLTKATVDSLNTVFYALASKVGKDKVADMASKSGITAMYNQDGKNVLPAGQTFNQTDLTNEKIGNEIGFGQYPVTPLDHANGYATLANGGVSSTVHFVSKVTDSKGKVIYDGNSAQNVKHVQAFTKDTAADIDYVLSKVASHDSQKIQDGRPQANKTGTWQYQNSTSENSHAWTGGYVPQLACAVWVGHQGNDGPITSPMNPEEGHAMYGWMEPGSIWANFMSAALNHLNMASQNFPPALHKNKGKPNSGQDGMDAPSPSPSHSSRPTGKPTNTCDFWNPDCQSGGGHHHSETPTPTDTPSCDDPFNPKCKTFGPGGNATGGG